MSQKNLSSRKNSLSVTELSDRESLSDTKGLLGVKDLLDRLEEYSKQDYVPMHMPGAKRNTGLFSMGNPYGLDITEIDGFDNMHNAKEILAESFKACAELFGAEESLYLVNGSSAGILSAICGATKKNDRVIVARNSHISVYNAMYLNELEPFYIYPAYKCEEAGICGGVMAAQIEEAFCELHKLYGQNAVSAVIITSPTYEGTVSEVGKIAEITHKYGAVLIVDEAHGAHFNFSTEFPESAVKYGADAVIQSIHKTLPSFTQTALLHLNGERIDRDRVKMYWKIYQSTSPSYILMAGIDRCLTLLKNDGKRLFDAYIKKLYMLRRALSQLNNFELLDTDDISKIVLIADDGKRLYDVLRTDYHIQLEMASLKYVIAMTSIGDTEEYYERFINAMLEIDNSWQNIASQRIGKGLPLYAPCSRRYNLYEASGMDKEYVELKSAYNRMAGTQICFYPPGVPLIVPGEVISHNHIASIEAGLKAGLEVIGIEADIALSKHKAEAENISSKPQNPAAFRTKNEEIKILCLK